jgi:GT2 family glycosyltransferase
MSNNYHFVIATQYSSGDFWGKSQIALFLEKTYNENNCSIFFENKQGLPYIYNKFINESYKDKKVIFLHDDVLIEDLFWEEKLDIAFENYDIIGLAGSKKCDLTKPPAWHLMSDREYHVGEVAHCHDKKVWTTVFGSTSSRALLLDGLFLGVNISRLLETNTFFDEDFSFHHYDITFCIRANSQKLKMGVCPLKVVHFGLGDSMNTPEWRESAGKFIQKYNGFKKI